MVPSRSFMTNGVDVSVNIDIAIYLTKVTGIFVGAWLYKTLKSIDGNPHVKINSKKIPINNPNAPNLICGEIDSEANEK